MIEPEHPTEDHIRGRIAFHESAAEFYAEHGDRRLAEWARDQAKKWIQKLASTPPNSTP